MQSMFTGFGSGGRMRTLLSGIPLLAAAVFFERAAIVPKALDQPADQVVRPGVWNIAHQLRHVHDRIALHHAPV